MALKPTQDKPEILDDQQPEFGPSDGDMAEAASHETPAEEADDAARAAQLAALGGVLYAKFVDAERKRQNIELRWLEDLRQFHGRYDPSVERDLSDSESCTLFLNITKPKTNAFSARVMDMGLPTDEKNWGLSATPVPEISGMDTQNETPAMSASPDGTQQQVVTPDGNTVLEKDIADSVKKEAKSRCEKMEEEIDDQLTESRHNSVQRQAIEQMARLGTGIVLGPVVVDEWKVKWQPSLGPVDPVTGKANSQWERKLVPNKDKRPGVQWVDCWNFYPDMSTGDPKGWDHVFIQHLCNAAEFRKIAKRFNFDRDKTKEILAGKTPTFNVRTLSWMNELRSLSDNDNFVDSRYRLLRYFGNLSYDDLMASGMDPESMGIEEDDDIFGNVWFCDNTVLRIDLNPLDSGDIPISVCYCDKDEASPFGIGMPRLMRGEQDSVNSAWRMKHDNGGLSVCPQTVIRLNSVRPADGDYHMKPRKLWYAADDVVKVSDVFGQFAIDSHQEELDNILQLGIRFADDVTQLPLLMQGDQAPHITQTAQGMSLLYNASTVVLRRTIKFLDDYMTEPLISRFYEWNMQFNPRDDIKGDFRCVARGSSTLLDKEQQGKSLDMAMQLAMQPTWQPYTDMKKLYQQALTAKRIQDIILSDDEIKKNLEVQAQQAQAAAQAGQKAPAGPAGMDPAAVQLEQDKIAVKREEIAARREATASAERIQIARMAQDQNLSIQDAAAKLAGIKVQADSKIQMFNSELDMKQRQGSGI